MTRTLDQARAAHAWRCVSARRRSLNDFSDYKKLAKGAPALVMGSGLMAALAFWQSRGKQPAEALVQDLLSWLAERKLLPAQFEPAMAELSGRTSAAQYMALTEEVLALLRWLRQFADAADPGEVDR
jgi:CRISPR-associated protein Cmr5